MGRFLSKKHEKLEPYIPGEQPKDKKYIKLNTNESPFAPSPHVRRALDETYSDLALYPDPECLSLRRALAEYYGVTEDMVAVGCGSDEILSFCFNAFFHDKGVVFPDITYGFYKVYADLYHIPYECIPLEDDFTINVSKYLSAGAGVVIANPNAPTGIALTHDEIEKIVKENPDNIVLIDEAYADFSNVTAIDLVSKYDNLIVVRTFSKSRSLAGARIGFCIASAEIINDVSLIKNSLNPYNLSRMALAAGEAAIKDDKYYKERRDEVVSVREEVKRELDAMGFKSTDSAANFVFARAEKMGGKELAAKLRERGILVRRFDTPRIRDFLRVTIGSRDEMNEFLKAVREILDL